MNNGEFYLADAIDVICEVLDSGGDFRLYPKGTSMQPLIIQGEDSVVLVKSKGALPAKKHDIAFYRRPNGQFVLHRVIKIEKNGTYTMCGDNQLVLEKGVTPQSIIAYVGKIYKKDKELGLKSFRYSLYVFFWTIMPLRRVLRYIVGKTMALFRRIKKKK